MNKRTLISIGVVTVLALGGAFALWLAENPSNDQLPAEDLKLSQSDDTIDSNKAGDDVNQNPSSDSQSNTSDPSHNTDNDTYTSKPDTHNDPADRSDGEYGINIASWGQYDDGTVYVNALVDDLTTGQCELTMNLNGQTVTATTPLEYAPTGYYACNFELARSRFSSSGSWSTQVVATNGDVTLRSQVEEVAVE